MNLTELVQTGDVALVAASFYAHGRETFSPTDPLYCTLDKAYLRRADNAPVTARFVVVSYNEHAYRDSGWSPAVPSYCGGFESERFVAIPRRVFLLYHGLFAEMRSETGVLAQGMFPSTSCTVAALLTRFTLDGAMLLLDAHVGLRTADEILHTRGSGSPRARGRNRKA